MSITIPKNIAVIGAGAAGLAASHLLSKKHQVFLFEAGPTIGGHAHSETLFDPSTNRSFEVDTAFLIFNECTYGSFLKFIRDLGVDTRAIRAEMSSCFSDPTKDLHYALGNGLKPFIARPSVLFRPEFAQILRDLIKFRKRAAADIENDVDLSGVTTAEYLAPYSAAFVENFVYPLTASIWSMPSRRMSECPISTLLKYFHNHQLLSGRSPRAWRTFHGSSSVYVNAFAKNFQGKIYLSTPVQGVRRTEDSVLIRTAKGSMPFDVVVMATHADTSLKLLENPTAEEKRLLGSWKYHDNQITLHRDNCVMHPDQRLWCSWNTIRKMRHGQEEYKITYFLNRLQNLETSESIFLSLGDQNFASSKVIKIFNYRHPILNASSIQTQPQLESLNGIDRLYFCGSYFGYGFHEDAVKSATQVAQMFGLSWETKSSHADRSKNSNQSIIVRKRS